MINSTKSQTRREKLGQSLRLFRTRNNITAREMAKIIKVSRESYSQREAGQVKMCATELVLLCQAHAGLHQFIMIDQSRAMQ